MEQTFQSEHYLVTIIINDGLIEFFRTDQLKRHNDWLNDLDDYQIEDLDEDEKQCNNFYCIEVSDWVSDYKTTRQGINDYDNWHRHIKTKYWFTNEMYNWLNKNLIK